MSNFGSPIKKEENSHCVYDRNFMIQIQQECSTFDPVLVFLLGFNYCKFGKDHQTKSFIELAKIIQDSIYKRKPDSSDLDKIYSNFFDQEYLSEVLGHVWFRIYQEDFEKSNTQTSKIIQRPKMNHWIKKEESKEQTLQDNLKVDYSSQSLKIKKLI